MATITEIFAAVNPTNSVSFTSTALATGANIGDLVVIIASGDTTDAISNTSITDAADGVTFGSNTWTLTPSFPENAAHRAGIWWSVLTTAWTAGTSKVRFTTGGASHKQYQVWLVPNVTGVAVDKTTVSANQATTTTPTTGTTAATTNANDIVIGVHLYSSNPTYTPPAGYTQTATTQQTASGGACSHSAFYKIVAATGTQVGVATLGTTQTAGGGIMALTYVDGAAPLTWDKVTVPIQSTGFDIMEYGSRNYSGFGPAPADWLTSPASDSNFPFFLLS